MLAAIITAPAAPAAATTAATLYVGGTSAADAGNCQSAAAPCATISYAVGQADELANRAITIDVAAGLYVDSVTVDLPGTDTLTVAGVGDPTVTSAPGATTITVTAGVVTLTGLDINRAAGDAPSEGTGPGISASSSVTVTDSTIAGTTGGALLAGGSAIVTDDAFTNDTASGGGAAINVGGSQTNAYSITGDTFSNDSVTYPDGSYGGAIALTGYEVDATMTGDTFVDDSAQEGGAVYTSNDTLATLSNDTFDNDGDLAADSWMGGAVWSEGQTTVSFDTFDTFPGEPGAGLDVEGEAAILTGNIFEGGGSGVGCSVSSGTVYDHGYNVSDDASTGCLSSADHDLTGVADTGPGGIDLGTLAGNGGPTQTQAITAASAAYHLVPVADCPAGDQRGVARPQPSGSTTCDAGAFEASGTPGGSVTVTSASALIGNASVSVTGAGWNANGDSTVSAYECTSTVQQADSCSAALGSGPVTAGAVGLTVDLVAGTLDGAGATCGLAASGDCYLVVVGNTGDESASEALPFSPPLVSVGRAGGVLGNQADPVTGGDFPIGATVTATECDAAVVVATLATHCDAATTISGTANAGGTVTFSPKTMTMRVGSTFSDSASGSCVPAGVCALALTDSQDHAVTVVEDLLFAGPVAKVNRSAGAIGNRPDTVTARGFPIGDTVTATECDASVTTPTLAAHCDAATTITGHALRGGGLVAFSPGGVTLRVGSAFADSAAGTCGPTSPCDVVVRDTSNPAFSVTVPVAFATPTVALVPNTTTAGGQTIAVVARGYPAGDTVTATECDTAYTIASASHCDTATLIASAAGIAGTTFFAPARLSVLTTTTATAYHDTDSGSCAAGDTVAAGHPCFVAATDASNAAVPVVDSPLSVG